MSTARTVTDTIAAMAFGTISDVYAADGTVLAPVVPRDVALAAKRIRRREIVGAPEGDIGKRQIVGHTVEIEMQDRSTAMGRVLAKNCTRPMPGVHPSPDTARLKSAGLNGPGTDVQRARRERTFISKETAGPTFVPQPRRLRTAFVAVAAPWTVWAPNLDPGRAHRGSSRERFSTCAPV